VIQIDSTVEHRKTDTPAREARVDYACNLKAPRDPTLIKFEHPVGKDGRGMSREQIFSQQAVGQLIYALTVTTQVRCHAGSR
jgi:hypothetical protein